MRRLTIILALCALPLALVSCKSAKQQQPGTATTPGAMGMQDTSINGRNMAGGMAMGAITVSSTAFADSATIPKQYTCEGMDMSPPLAWSGVPSAAKTVAMILDDPDAPMGTWTHWIIWNIPASTTSLSEGMPKDATVSGGIRQGRNSWPKTGYGGPCPPPGKPHHYYFTVYTLDTTLSLPDSTNRAQLEAAMKGHILAQGQLLGMYAKTGKQS
jgi:Raf kinase inhibitor-like YbhB/YbcL family protein